MLTAYEANFAADWGYKAQDVVAALGPSVFGVELNPRNKAKDNWRVRGLMGRQLRGIEAGMITAGAGGALTGKGAQLLIIDDPIKNPEDALSPSARQKVWEWYLAAVQTRLEKGGAVILIMCLAGDSRVPLADGRWLPIRDVKPGVEVFAYTDAGFVKRKVLGQRSSGFDHTIKIQTQRLSLTVNRRHPFLVVPDDGRARPFFKPVWRTAGELEKGDLVVTASKLPTKGKAPLKKWNVHSMGWFLGFLFGDGWVTSWARRNKYKTKGDDTIRWSTSRSWCVCAALGVDDALNEKVAKCFEKAFGRLPRRKIKERYWRLDCNSAGRELELLGLKAGVRALEKRIPQWVFGMGSIWQMEFLRGLVDADGSKQSSSYVLTSGSPDLVEDARLLALTCGVRVGRLRVYDHVSQPPNSPKPIHSKFCSASFTFPGDNCDRMGASLITGKLPLGVRVERIVSIEEDEHQEVFDLAVDGEANFVAEGFVVHNTRWHSDDLAGRCIKADRDGIGEGWETIILPALAEENDPIGRAVGEALWEDVISREELEARRLLQERTSRWVWQALYQQRPPDLTGGFFPTQNLGFVHHYEVPMGCRWVRFWDFASSRRRKSAMTAGVLMAHHPRSGETYICDVVMGKYTPHDVKKLVEVTARRDRKISNRQGVPIPVRWEEEPGSSGHFVTDDLVRVWLKGFDADGIRVTGNKELRADPLAAAMNHGLVSFVNSGALNNWYSDTGNNWNEPVKEQFAGFPDGSLKDAVDSSSGGYMFLVGMHSGNTILEPGQILDAEEDTLNDFREELRAGMDAESTLDHANSTTIEGPEDWSPWDDLDSETEVF